MKQKLRRLFSSNFSSTSSSSPSRTFNSTSGFNSTSSSGFTMIELLITIAILSVIIILALMSWKNQINKARDAQRKTDLERIRIAFENYYNDNDCFPEETILQTCGGDSLNPYLNNIPCDPIYNLPYCYIHDPDDACGQNFKLLAPLQNTSDPIIEKLLCDGILYCGQEGSCEINTSPPANSTYEGFNYCVTSSNIPLCYSVGQNACNPLSGVCKSYADPVASGCPRTYDDDECDGQCADPDNWCAD